MITPIAEIKYKPRDLLLLMYEHMLGAGLTESASTLLREARLQEALNARRQQMTGRDGVTAVLRRNVTRTGQPSGVQQSNSVSPT